MSLVETSWRGQSDDKEWEEIGELEESNQGEGPSGLVTSRFQEESDPRDTWI